MANFNDIVKSINALNKKISKNQQTDDFYNEAQKCHNERINQERLAQKTKEYKAAMQYSLFSCWCQQFKDTQPTIEKFKKYITQENVQIDFWIKKEIAEKYFNYSYQYNQETKKWKATKGERTL